MSDLMLNDRTTNKTLEQVFNKYKIPLRYIGFDEDMPKPSNEGMYIINLGDNVRGGTHWTGLWYEDGKTYYFDSLGFRPPKTILKKIGMNPYWSDEMLQHPDEGLCGLYQFIFAYYMHKYRRQKPKERYLKFILLFRTDNLRLNQRIIVNEYNKIRKKKAFKL